MVGPCAGAALPYTSITFSPENVKCLSWGQGAVVWRMKCGNTSEPTRPWASLEFGRGQPCHPSGAPSPPFTPWPRSYKKWSKDGKNEQTARYLAGPEGRAWGRLASHKWGGGISTCEGRRKALAFSRLLPEAVIPPGGSCPPRYPTLQPCRGTGTWRGPQRRRRGFSAAPTWGAGSKVRPGAH